MRSLRSVAAGGRDRAGDVAKDSYTRFAAQFSQKLYWFLSKGYRPHEWQAAFHSASDDAHIAAAPEQSPCLVRFRHLVAGRRGGKTLSAAWEVLFYCLYPAEFHRDVHGAQSDRPLWVNVLTADHEVGRPARMAFQRALNEAGLVHGKDYKWNKSEQTIEFFDSGTFLQFRTAVDPQSLRGAGLDILWIDESAFIKSRDAWDVIRASLGDTRGIVITTTTPKGKNWFYEEFFFGDSLDDSKQWRVEYTSIDNPYYPREEWEYNKKHMHPSLFKQEHMAAFDAMSGLTLDGEWIKFYVLGTPEAGEVSLREYRDEEGRIRLRKYVGVDPSTGEAADEFAICCVGVTEDNSMAFLLDYWKGLIQFPDQIDKIREWQTTWRPQLMGIESNAYQRSLAQMGNRLEGFPAVVPVISKGRKNERIISMSPLFKVGKVRIHGKHHAFIDQWVSFDAKRRDNRDDLLDAVEIALGVAGVMLPTMDVPDEKAGPLSFHEEAREQIAHLKDRAPYDYELGVEG